MSMRPPQRRRHAPAAARAPGLDGGIPAPLSRRLQSLNLLFLIFVVAIHSTTFFMCGASPPPSQRRPLEAAARGVQTFVAFGVARVAVPGFFLVSGYLFFRTVAAPADVVAKMRRRIGTLAVPYLAWSALTLAALVAASHLPLPGGMGAALAEHRAARGTGDLLYTLVLDPVPGQLWFVRDLIVLTAAAPLILWLLRRAGLLLPAVALVAWAVLPGHVVPEHRHPLQIVSWTGVLFFSLGGLLGIRRPGWLEETRIASALVAVSLLMTWLGAVALRFGGDWPLWFDRLLDRLAILVGLAAVWVGYDLYSGLVTNRAVAWLSPLGFFVFAAHYPLTRFTVREALQVTGCSGGAQLAVYAAVIPIMLVVCGAAGLLLRRWSPSVFALLNGFRPAGRPSAV